VRLATVPDLVLVAGRPFVLFFSHPVGRRVRRLRRPQPFEPEQVPSATTPVECEEEERAEEPEDDGMTQEVGPAVPFPDGLPPGVLELCEAESVCTTERRLDVA